MADNKNAGAQSDLHETEGSMLRGWPAMLLTIAMVGAAIYSFSPRSYPAFPPTQIKADGFLANSVAQQGDHFIAVGERGVMLYAENPEGPWHDGEVDKTRGATLTRVRFIAENIALAVGHNGWIIRSEDAGKTWQEIQFDEDSSDPLLDIGGPWPSDGPSDGNGKLFVTGSFGQFEVSTDLGLTWQEEILNISDAAGEDSDQASTSATDPDSDDYDPFAAFAEGGGAQNSGTEHLNGITQLEDGSLMIVGERGLLLRSGDNGETWNRLEEIYAGSFYGALTTPDNSLLVYGMRGNAFVSQDQGKTWGKSQIPVQQGLFQGTVTDDGKILLVGASDTVLISSDNGQSFKLAASTGTDGLVSVVPLKKNSWLTAGEGGVAIMHPEEKARPAKRDGDKS